MRSEKYLEKKRELGKLGLQILIGLVITVASSIIVFPQSKDGVISISAFMYIYIIFKRNASLDFKAQINEIIQKLIMRSLFAYL